MSRKRYRPGIFLYSRPPKTGPFGYVPRPYMRQKRLFGGCHLTRPIVDLLADNGFVVKDVDVFYEKGAPKVLAAESLGVAVPA